jgi:hypothetical protein
MKRLLAANARQFGTLAVLVALCGVITVLTPYLTSRSRQRSTP